MQTTEVSQHNSSAAPRPERAKCATCTAQLPQRELDSFGGMCPPCSFKRERDRKALVASIAKADLPALAIVDADHFEPNDEQREAGRVLSDITGHRASKTGALITGGVGSGKTVTVVREALRFLRGQNGGNVRYAAVGKLLLDIRATFGNPRRTDVDVLEPLMGAGILILDDLGSEKASDWSVDVIFTIIDARYQNGRPTFITSNFGPDRLAQHLAPRDERIQADRIVDRLIAMCTWLPFQGKSLRSADSAPGERLRAVQSALDESRRAPRFQA